MSWQIILKMDMREARRLGREYAPKDMYASNPKYVNLKRRLESLLPIDNKKEERIVRMEEEEYLETGDKDSLRWLEYYIGRIARRGGKK